MNRLALLLSRHMSSALSEGVGATLHAKNHTTNTPSGGVAVTIHRGAARGSTWLVPSMTAALLALIVVHLWLQSGLVDPQELYGHRIGTDRSVTSYWLWARSAYQQVTWAALGLLGLGLGLQITSRWIGWRRMPGQIAGLVGAIAAAGTQLLQPAFWHLGLGLPRWTWTLPVRLGLITAAVAAILLILRPSLHRWAARILAAALACLALLLLVPQLSQEYGSYGPLMYCGVYLPTYKVAACEKKLVLPERQRELPVVRIVRSVPFRVNAQAMLERRLYKLRTCPDGPHDSSSDIGKWIGSPLWKAQVGEVQNAQIHLIWQDVRLCCLVLLLLGGLPLVLRLLLGRRRRGRHDQQHWEHRPDHHPVHRLRRLTWRGILAATALLATAAATGILPEWSQVPLTHHLPTTLLLPVAVLSLAAGIARLRSDSTLLSAHRFLVR